MLYFRDGPMCWPHLLNVELSFNVPDRGITNYLYDFLNIALSQVKCDHMIGTFHQLCNRLGVPIAKEKTIWATLMLVFLGVLLDGEKHIMAIPLEKIQKAQYMLDLMIVNKKAKVKDIEKLTGLLNFLSRAIYPGRAFTRRMYASIQYKCRNLKQHHHISLNHEFHQDCLVWAQFLSQKDQISQAFYRPFIDLSVVVDADEIGFYTDSSANKNLGFGGVISDWEWFFGQWEDGYITEELGPSIEYLELLAVCIGLFIWTDQISNKRVQIHCDNVAVVYMINKTSSACKHCMHLIHLLVLRSLTFNFTVFAKYVKSKDNDQADSLSRLQFEHFRKLAPKRNRFSSGATETIMACLKNLECTQDFQIQHLIHL